MALGGLAILRVIFAVAALHLYLTNYTERRSLWGRQSVFPYEMYEPFTSSPLAAAYSLSEADWYFELVFHAGIVAAALMLFGVGGRCSVIAHAFFHISLYLRNPLIMDGGDNLAHIALIMLCFTTSTAYLAVQPGRIRRRLVAPAGLRTAIVNPLHNAAVIAIGFQVLVIYWASAMYKIQGRMWQDGVAIYYILRVPEFEWPGVSELIYQNRWLVFSISWFTVWLQLAFPPMVLSERFRVPILVIAMMFHLGIAFLMNLWTFSLYMIGAEAIFWPDRITARLHRGRPPDSVPSRTVEPEHSSESGTVRSPWARRDPSEEVDDRAFLGRNCSRPERLL